jgi:hypothetical protein
MKEYLYRDKLIPGQTDLRSGPPFKYKSPQNGELRRYQQTFQ